jgi:hypothetical protein
MLWQERAMFETHKEIMALEFNPYNQTLKVMCVAIGLLHQILVPFEMRFQIPVLLHAQHEAITQLHKHLARFGMIIQPLHHQLQDQPVVIITYQILLARFGMIIQRLFPQLQDQPVVIILQQIHRALFEMSIQLRLPRDLSVKITALLLHELKHQQAMEQDITIIILHQQIQVYDQ